MKEYKEYIPTTEFAGNTHIEVYIYYSKGHMTSAGNVEKRGFYMSVYPVEKCEHFVSCVLGSGVRDFILETKRYSDKQYDIAVEKGKEKLPELIDCLRKKHNIAA